MYLRDGSFKLEDDAEAADVKSVREALNSNTGRKLFAYMTLDDKYGQLFRDEEANVKAFLKREDQREYDALCEVVTANRIAEGLQPFEACGVGKSSLLNTFVLGVPSTNS